MNSMEGRWAGRLTHWEKAEVGTYNAMKVRCRIHPVPLTCVIENSKVYEERRHGLSLVGSLVNPITESHDAVLGSMVTCYPRIARGNQTPGLLLLFISLN